jgi:secreted trypsin-like serine protease
VRRAPALLAALGLAAVASVASVGAVVPPAGAVVGGDESDLGDWPWQVALVDGGFQFCGGSLVTLDVVVTAAHCTEDAEPGDFDVVAGAVDLDDRGAGDRREVVAIDEHPEYDPRSGTSDISILRLESPFDASDTIRPVRIADERLAAALTEEGLPAIVTGFGSTSEDGSGSPTLREGLVETVGDDTCVADYDGDADVGEVVTPASEVCAGLREGGVDACFGDSGGPLVVPVDGDPDVGPDGWVLVGIVAWGDGCGQPELPTVYTQVDAFADFVVEQTAGVDEDHRYESERPIRVPAVGTRGKGGPFPSTVEVDGFDGEVSSVAVELIGVTHGRASDLDVWLVAPDGTTVALLSDAGGDAALDDGVLLVEPSGPPAGDAGVPVVLAATDVERDPQLGDLVVAAGLDDLAGIDPQGTWRLLVADDRDGEAGVIGRWTLLLG